MTFGIADLTIKTFYARYKLQCKWHQSGHE